MDGPMICTIIDGSEMILDFLKSFICAVFHTEDVIEAISDIQHQIFDVASQRKKAAYHEYLALGSPRGYGLEHFLVWAILNGRIDERDAPPWVLPELEKITDEEHVWRW